MRIKSLDMIAKPSGPGVPAYYQKYIDLVDATDLLSALEIGKTNTIRLMQGLSSEQLHFSYAPGKWSIAQVFTHIMDTERVFIYRALAFARGDQTALPGFDENAYAAQDFSESRTASNLLAEYESVRQATTSFFRYANSAA